MGGGAWGEGGGRGEGGVRVILHLSVIHVVFKKMSFPYNFYGIN